MSVEWSSGFTLYGQALEYGAAQNTLTLTPFSVGTQTNQILILSVITQNAASAAPSVSTIDYSEGTFIKFFEGSYQGGKVKVEAYYIVNPVVSASKTITITLSAAAEICAGHVGAFRNAYQGAPLAAYVEDETVLHDTAIAPSHPDPDSDGALHDIAFNYSPTSSLMTEVSGQTSVSSSVGGVRSILFTILGSLSVPQATGYVMASGADNYAVVVSIQIKPAGWVPLDSPVDGATYCEYVSVGEVRKMVDSVSGLDHFEGETIAIQMDGILPTDENGDLVTNEFEVSGGGITLPKKAAVVHAGLPYEGIIQLLKSSNGSELGTGQMKTRRTYLAVLRLYKSLGLKIGIDEDYLYPIFDETPALPLFTGDQDKLPDTSWEKDTEFILKMEDPLPCFILAVLLRSDLEEN